MMHLINFKSTAGTNRDHQRARDSQIGPRTRTGSPQPVPIDLARTTAALKWRLLPLQSTEYFYRPGPGQKQVVAAGSVVRPALVRASCIAPFSVFHRFVILVFTLCQAVNQGHSQEPVSAAASIWFVVSMPGHGVNGEKS